VAYLQEPGDLGRVRLPEPVVQALKAPDHLRIARGHWRGRHRCAGAAKALAQRGGTLGAIGEERA
jgi:hypothetical protein